MTKNNKDALDALEYIYSTLMGTDYDVPLGVHESHETIRTALTKEAARTEGVREAIDEFKYARPHDQDPEYVIWMVKKIHVETLIRAAQQNMGDGE